MFHIELVVKAAELMFDPPLSELEAVIHRLISTIVEAAQGLLRVCHKPIPLQLSSVCCVLGGACAVPRAGGACT